MKIICTCDHYIVDQTDYLRNKGYIISDTQWFEFWEAIDRAVENLDLTPKEAEAALMQLRLQKVFRTAWECPNCGKLFVEGQDGGLVLFSPDEAGYHRVLDRIE